MKVKRLNKLYARILAVSNHNSNAMALIKLTG